ncbi:hypothetical protein NJ76_11005, partial [Rhodococcus sp. IITR03]
MDHQCHHGVVPGVEDRQPHRQLCRQIEAVTDRLGQRIADIGRVDRTVVGDHADLVGREHQLVGLPVRAREDRAQRLVAQDDVAHGGFECRDVDAPVHPPRDGHVVHAAAGSELVEDPQACCALRQRHHRPVADHP